MTRRGGAPRTAREWSQGSSLRIHLCERHQRQERSRAAATNLPLSDLPARGSDGTRWRHATRSLLPRLLASIRHRRARSNGRDRRWKTAAVRRVARRVRAAEAHSREPAEEGLVGWSRGGLADERAHRAGDRPSDVRSSFRSIDTFWLTFANHRRNLHRDGSSEASRASPPPRHPRRLAPGRRTQARRAPAGPPRSATGVRRTLPLPRHPEGLAGAALAAERRRRAGRDRELPRGRRAPRAARSGSSSSGSSSSRSRTTTSTRSSKPTGPRRSGVG